jgi:arylsulfatase A-like enzyme
MTLLRSLPVLAALLLALAAGCSPQPPRIDTLRWDHLGAYGYERDTSPAIDALAAQGLRFDRAYVTAPWTMPSVASMITGLYPSGHGVKNVMSGTPMSLHTLAEILRERGYQTAGVVSNRLLINKLEKGFAQGYDVYLGGDARGHDHVSSESVTDKSIRILERFAEDGHRFLLFVNYFDPHFNYLHHQQIGFAPARVGRLDGHQDIGELREMLGELSDEELGFLRDLYDEEIRITDAGIGRLLARLGELELAESTLVLLTADHGEEFRERGWLGHTRSLYEELMRVPLVIRMPGARRVPRVVEAPVSLVSLTPTILELLGIEIADFGFQGPSLAPLVLGRGDPEPGPPIAEVDYVPPGDPRSIKRAFKKAIIDGRFKLIRDDESGRIELYDLDTDPEERRSLAEERPQLRDRLLRQLDARLVEAARGAVAAPERQLAEDEIEALRGLGYLGS